MFDDGIPVVDLDGNFKDNNENEDDKTGCDCGCEDNVVEFGDTDIVEKLEVNNVVEF